MGGWKTKILWQFVEEEEFFYGMMQHNISSIRKGVCCVGLLLGAPGNDARAQGEAVTTDEATGVQAIGIVRVRMTKKGGNGGATQYES